MILIICFSFWECIFVFLQINTNQINLRDYEKKNCELLLLTIDFNHCWNFK
jgi:hypothetical protein